MKQPNENECEHCTKIIDGAYYSCTECCDHEPDPNEGYMCLSCGKECYEDVAAAYDRYKDRMKYGED